MNPRPATARWLRRAAALALTAFCTSALAQQPDPAAGRSIVVRDCAACHAVDREGASPLAKAPAFRNLHLKYQVEDLAESLAEGIMAGHPAMPSKPYEPVEVDAMIAYLRSLQPAAEPSAESEVR